MSCDIRKSWPPLVAVSDHIRLSALLHKAPPESARGLAEKLQKACLMLDDQLPHDAIRLGSTVTISPHEGSLTTFTVVHPDEVGDEKPVVSVLAPVGMALLGLRSQQEGVWFMRGGRMRRATILSVGDHP